VVQSELAKLRHNKLLLHIARTSNFYTEQLELNGLLQKMIVVELTKKILRLSCNQKFITM
jgi:hypothetical protein